VAVENDEAVRELVRVSLVVNLAQISLGRITADPGRLGGL
jgi:hypothetical protein